MAGIEIDTDFRRGYEALITATDIKGSEAKLELEGFVNKFTLPDGEVSLSVCCGAIRDKIDRRCSEVKAVIDAANAHLVADHSRIDVLLQASFSLTFNPLPNPYHNPSPDTNHKPPTPNTNLTPTPNPPHNPNPPPLRPGPRI